MPKVSFNSCETRCAYADWTCKCCHRVPRIRILRLRLQEWGARREDCRIGHVSSSTSTQTGLSIDGSQGLEGFQDGQTNPERATFGLLEVHDREGSWTPGEDLRVGRFGTACSERCGGAYDLVVREIVKIVGPLLHDQDFVMTQPTGTFDLPPLVSSTLKQQTTTHFQDLLHYAVSRREDALGIAAFRSIALFGKRNGFDIDFKGVETVERHWGSQQNSAIGNTSWFCRKQARVYLRRPKDSYSHCTRP
jgi:hypothetical protein